MNSRNSARRGITRREVALTVAAIAVLLAIALPYLYRQRYFARRNLCEARHYRASLALVQTALDQGEFPGYRNLQTPDLGTESRRSSWVFSILPYIHPLSEEISIAPRRDQEGASNPPWIHTSGGLGPIATTGPYNELFREYGPDGPAETRGQMPNRYIPELICPDDPNVTSTEGSPLSLVANCGMPDVTATSEFPADWRSNGVFLDQVPGNGKLELPMTLEYLESKDGLGSVVMISENVDSGMWTDTAESKVGFVWTVRHSDAPTSLFKEVWDFNESVGEGKGTIHSARPTSNHINGFNVAFCNGSTRFITDDIDPLVWTWMLMPDATNARYPGTNQLLPPTLLRPVNPNAPDSATSNVEAEKQTGGASGEE